MATDKVPPSPSQLQSAITANQIMRYAEVSAQITKLETEQKKMRGELLTLHKAGAGQEETSPYVLAFIDQERRTVDWKDHALTLAEKLYGIEKAATWKAKAEQTAPVQLITQIRVQPNAAYVAGLEAAGPKKPAASAPANTPVANQRKGGESRD